MIGFLPSVSILLPQAFIRLESTPDAMFRTDNVKYALIGLMRDLRGIAMATNRFVFCNFSFAFFLLTKPQNNLLFSLSLDVCCSRRTYGFLFDWLYPAHFPLLLRGISHWTDTPEVIELFCFLSKEHF